MAQTRSAFYHFNFPRGLFEFIIRAPAGAHARGFAILFGPNCTLTANSFTNLRAEPFWPSVSHSMSLDGSQLTILGRPVLVINIPYFQMFDTLFLHRMDRVYAACNAQRPTGCSHFWEMSR